MVTKGVWTVGKEKRSSKDSALGCSIVKRSKKRKPTSKELPEEAGIETKAKEGV